MNRHFGGYPSSPFLRVTSTGSKNENEVHASEKQPRVTAAASGNNFSNLDNGPTSLSPAQRLAELNARINQQSQHLMSLQTSRTATTPSHSSEVLSPPRNSFQHSRLHRSVLTPSPILFTRLTRVDNISNSIANTSSSMPRTTRIFSPTQLAHPTTGVHEESFPKLRVIQAGDGDGVVIVTPPQSREQSREKKLSSGNVQSTASQSLKDGLSAHPASHSTRDLPIASQFGAEVPLRVLPHTATATATRKPHSHEKGVTSQSPEGTPRIFALPESYDEKLVGKQKIPDDLVRAYIDHPENRALSTIFGKNRKNDLPEDAIRKLDIELEVALSAKSRLSERVPHILPSSSSSSTFSIAPSSSNTSPPSPTSSRSRPRSVFSRTTASPSAHTLPSSPPVSNSASSTPLLTTSASTSLITSSSTLLSRAPVPSSAVSAATSSTFIANTDANTHADTHISTATDAVTDTITDTVTDTITDTVTDTITDTVTDTITDTAADTVTDTAAVQDSLGEYLNLPSNSSSLSSSSPSTSSPSSSFLPTPILSAPPRAAAPHTSSVTSLSSPSLPAPSTAPVSSSLPSTSTLSAFPLHASSVLVKASESSTSSALGSSAQAFSAVSAPTQPSQQHPQQHQDVIQQQLNTLRSHEDELLARAHDRVVSQQILSLEGRAEGYRAMIMELYEANIGKTEAIHTQEAEIEHLRRELGYMRERSAENEEKMRVLEQEQDKKSERLREEHKKLQNEYEECCRRCETVQQGYTTLQQQYAHQQVLCSSLESDVQRKEGEIQRMNGQLLQLSSTVDKCKEDLEKLTHNPQMDQTTQHNMSLRLQLFELQTETELNQLKSTSDKEKEIYAMKKELFQQLRQLEEKQQDEMQKIKVEWEETIEKERDDFKNTVVELKKEVLSVRKERDELQYRYANDIQQLQLAHQQQLREIDSTNSDNVKKMISHYKQVSEDLVEHHREEVSLLRVEYAQIHDTLRTEHVEQREKMEREYEKTMLELKTQYRELQSRWEEEKKAMESREIEQAYSLKIKYQEQVGQLTASYKQEMHEMRAKYEELIQKLTFHAQFGTNEVEHSHKLAKQVTEFENQHRIVSLEEENKRLELLLSQSEQDQEQLSRLLTEKQEELHDLQAQFQSLTSEFDMISSDFEILQRKHTQMQSDFTQRLTTLQETLSSEQERAATARDAAEKEYKAQQVSYETLVKTMQVEHAGELRKERETHQVIVQKCLERERGTAARMTEQAMRDMSRVTDAFRREKQQWLVKEQQRQVVDNDLSMVIRCTVQYVRDIKYLYTQTMEKVVMMVHLMERIRKIISKKSRKQIPKLPPLLSQLMTCMKDISQKSGISEIPISNFSQSDSPALSSLLSSLGLPTLQSLSATTHPTSPSPSSSSSSVSSSSSSSSSSSTSDLHGLPSSTSPTSTLPSSPPASSPSSSHPTSISTPTVLSSSATAIDHAAPLHPLLAQLLDVVAAQHALKQGLLDTVAAGKDATGQLQGYLSSVIPLNDDSNCCDQCKCLCVCAGRLREQGVQAGTTSIASEILHSENSELAEIIRNRKGGSLKEFPASVGTQTENSYSTDMSCQTELNLSKNSVVIDHSQLCLTCRKRSTHIESRGSAYTRARVLTANATAADQPLPTRVGMGTTGVSVGVGVDAAGACGNNDDSAANKGGRGYDAGMGMGNIATDAQSPLSVGLSSPNIGSTTTGTSPYSIDSPYIYPSDAHGQGEDVRRYIQEEEEEGEEVGVVISAKALIPSLSMCKTLLKQAMEAHQRAIVAHTTQKSGNLAKFDLKLANFGIAQAGEDNKKKNTRKKQKKATREDVQVDMDVKNNAARRSGNDTSEDGTESDDIFRTTSSNSRNGKMPDGKSSFSELDISNISEGMIAARTSDEDDDNEGIEGDELDLLKGRKRMSTGEEEEGAVEPSDDDGNDSNDGNDTGMFDFGVNWMHYEEFLDSSRTQDPEKPEIPKKITPKPKSSAPVFHTTSRYYHRHCVAGCTGERHSPQCSYSGNVASTGKNDNVGKSTRSRSSTPSRKSTVSGGESPRVKLFGVSWFPERENSSTRSGKTKTPKSSSLSEAHSGQEAGSDADSVVRVGGGYVYPQSPMKDPRSPAVISAFGPGITPAFGSSVHPPSSSSSSSSASAAASSGRAGVSNTGSPSWHLSMGASMGSFGHGTGTSMGSGMGIDMGEVGMHSLSLHTSPLVTHPSASLMERWYALRCLYNMVCARLMLLHRKPSSPCPASTSSSASFSSSSPALLSSSSDLYDSHFTTETVHLIEKSIHFIAKYYRLLYGFVEKQNKQVSEAKTQQFMVFKRISEQFKAKIKDLYAEREKLHSQLEETLPKSRKWDEYLKIQEKEASEGSLARELFRVSQELVTCTSSLHAKEHENAEISAKLQSIQEESTSLRSELEYCHRKYSDVTADIDRWKEEAAVARSQYAAAEEVQSSLRKHHELELTIQKQTLEGQIETVSAELREKSEKLRTLETILANKEEEIAGFAEERATFAAKIEEAEKEVRQLQEMLAREQEKCKKKDAEVAEYQYKNGMLQQRSVYLQERVDECMQHKAVMEEQMEKLQEQYDATLLRRQELQIQVQELNLQCTSLSGEVKKNQDDAKKMEDLCDRHREKYEALEGVYSEVRSRVVEMEMKYKEVCVSAQHWQAKVVELEEQMQCKIKEGREELNKSQEEGKKIQGELSHLTTEYRKLKKMYDDVNEEHVVIVGKYSKMKEIFQNMRHKYNVIAEYMRRTKTSLLTSETDKQYLLKKVKKISEKYRIVICRYETTLRNIVDLIHTIHHHSKNDDNNVTTPSIPAKGQVEIRNRRDIHAITATDSAQDGVVRHSAKTDDDGVVNTRVTNGSDVAGSSLEEDAVVCDDAVASGPNSGPTSSPSSSSSCATPTTSSSFSSLSSLSRTTVPHAVADMPSFSSLPVDDDTHTYNLSTHSSEHSPMCSLSSSPPSPSPALPATSPSSASPASLLPPDDNTDIDTFLVTTKQTLQTLYTTYTTLSQSLHASLSSLLAEHQEQSMDHAQMRHRYLSLHQQLRSQAVLENDVAQLQGKIDIFTRENEQYRSEIEKFRDNTEKSEQLLSRLNMDLSQCMRDNSILKEEKDNLHTIAEFASRESRELRKMLAKVVNIPSGCYCECKCCPLIDVTLLDDCTNCRQSDDNNAQSHDNNCHNAQIVPTVPYTSAVVEKYTGVSTFDDNLYIPPITSAQLPQPSPASYTSAATSTSTSPATAAASVSSLYSPSTASPESSSASASTYSSPSCSSAPSSPSSPSVSTPLLPSCSRSLLTPEASTTPLTHIPLLPASPLLPSALSPLSPTASLPPSFPAASSPCTSPSLRQHDTHAHTYARPVVHMHSTSTTKPVKPTLVQSLRAQVQTLQENLSLLEKSMSQRVSVQMRSIEKTLKEQYHADLARERTTMHQEKEKAVALALVDAEHAIEGLQRRIAVLERKKMHAGEVNKVELDELREEMERGKRMYDEVREKHRLDRQRHLEELMILKEKHEKTIATLLSFHKNDLLGIKERYNINILSLHDTHEAKVKALQKDWSAQLSEFVGDMEARLGEVEEATEVRKMLREVLAAEHEDEGDGELETNESGESSNTRPAHKTIGTANGNACGKSGSESGDYSVGCGKTRQGNGTITSGDDCMGGDGHTCVSSNSSDNHCGIRDSLSVNDTDVVMNLHQFLGRLTASQQLYVVFSIAVPVLLQFTQELLRMQEERLYSCDDKENTHTVSIVEEPEEKTDDPCATFSGKNDSLGASEKPLSPEYEKLRKNVHVDPEKVFKLKELIRTLKDLDTDVDIIRASCAPYLSTHIALDDDCNVVIVEWSDDCKDANRDEDKEDGECVAEKCGVCVHWTEAHIAHTQLKHPLSEYGKDISRKNDIISQIISSGKNSPESECAFPGECLYHWHEHNYPTCLPQFITTNVHTDNGKDRKKQEIPISENPVANGVRVSVMVNALVDVLASEPTVLKPLSAPTMPELSQTLPIVAATRTHVPNTPADVGEASASPGTVAAAASSSVGAGVSGVSATTHSAPPVHPLLSLLARIDHILSPLLLPETVQTTTIVKHVDRHQLDADGNCDNHKQLSSPSTSTSTTSSTSHSLLYSSPLQFAPMIASVQSAAHLRHFLQPLVAKLSRMVMAEMDVRPSDRHDYDDGHAAPDQHGRGQDVCDDGDYGYGHMRVGSTAGRIGAHSTGGGAKTGAVDGSAAAASRGEGNADVGNIRRDGASAGASARVSREQGKETPRPGQPHQYQLQQQQIKPRQQQSSLPLPHQPYIQRPTHPSTQQPQQQASQPPSHSVAQPASILPQHTQQDTHPHARPHTSQPLHPHSGPQPPQHAPRSPHIQHYPRIPPQQQQHHQHQQGRLGMSPSTTHPGLPAHSASLQQPQHLQQSPLPQQPRNLLPPQHHQQRPPQHNIQQLQPQPRPQHYQPPPAPQQRAPVQGQTGAHAQLPPSYQHQPQRQHPLQQQQRQVLPLPQQQQSRPYAAPSSQPRPQSHSQAQPPQQPFHHHQHQRGPAPLPSSVFPPAPLIHSDSAKLRQYLLQRRREEEGLLRGGVVRDSKAVHVRCSGDSNINGDGNGGNNDESGNNPDRDEVHPRGAPSPIDATGLSVSVTGNNASGESVCTSVSIDKEVVERYFRDSADIYVDYHPALATTASAMTSASTSSSQGVSDSVAPVVAHTSTPITAPASVLTRGKDTSASRARGHNRGGTGYDTGNRGRRGSVTFTADGDAECDHRNDDLARSHQECIFPKNSSGSHKTSEIISDPSSHAHSSKKTEAEKPVFRIRNYVKNIRNLAESRKKERSTSNSQRKATIPENSRIPATPVMNIIHYPLVTSSQNEETENPQLHYQVPESQSQMVPPHLMLLMKMQPSSSLSSSSSQLPKPTVPAPLLHTIPTYSSTENTSFATSSATTRLPTHTPSIPAATSSPTTNTTININGSSNLSGCDNSGGDGYDGHNSTNGETTTTTSNAGVPSSMPAIVSLYPRHDCSSTAHTSSCTLTPALAPASLQTSIYIPTLGSPSTDAAPTSAASTAANTHAVIDPGVIAGTSANTRVSDHGSFRGHGNGNGSGHSNGATGASVSDGESSVDNSVVKVVNDVAKVHEMHVTVYDGDNVVVKEQKQSRRISSVF